MQPHRFAGLVLAWTLGSAPMAAPAAEPAPQEGPGWTGLTHPQDVIDARQQLMMEIERIMKPIDLLSTGAQADPEVLRSTARTIGKMLLAVPQLFPPTTNLYDPKVETPVTIAMPAIWTSFPAFYQMAKASVAAADEMATLQDAKALPAAAAKLRATCDACHAPYLRPYVAEGVSSEDLNFDFDSVLKK
jgi:cytochrome c556